MRLCCTAVAAVSLIAPAGAGAAERVIAGPAPSSYSPPNPQVELDAGEALTFFNADYSARHDVTSVDQGAAGRPLFASATVGFGSEVPVVGAESLSAGSYDFICSIHPYMKGTVTVRGAVDRRAPTLSARALDKKIAAVLRAGKLRLEAKVDEAATLRVVATAGRGGAKVASGQRKVSSGTGRVAAKLTAKGRRLLEKADRVRLHITLRAEDAAGNTRKRTIGHTLS